MEVYTTLGHLLHDAKEVSEWYLYVYDEIHEELVYEFREYLRSKGRE